MRRARLLAAAALAVALGALPAAATPVVPGPGATGSRGNAMIEIDPFGVPIAMVRTLTLEPGAWYELQTYDLQRLPSTVIYPDTVITVRDGIAPESAVLAGADGCQTPGATFEYERSCVRFRVPTSYPSTVRLYVWVRAFDTGFEGTAWIRYQRVASATAVPGTSWTYPGARSFGGMVETLSGSGASGALRFETTLMPPYRASHLIVVMPGTRADPNTNWRMTAIARGGSGSHRRDIDGTAEWTGLGSEVGIVDRGIVVAGTVGTAAAPLRFIRNDRVTFSTSATYGRDDDRDELGADLEELLRTCDNPTSSTANGLRCDARPGCAPYSAKLCLASLRDSDGDGIRDDIETYGASVDGDSSTSEMPRYGADPARYDLFAEIDYQTSDGAGGCTNVPPLYTKEQLRDMARVYRAIPGFANRDGSNGIALHLDAGQRPDDLTETAYGDWGGSEQICVTDSGFPDEIDAKRRWLFHYVTHYNGGGGQTGGAPTLHSSAGQTLAVPHELGHQGGLDHGGPQDAPAKIANGTPNYWSRISYLFQEYGRAGLATPDPDIETVSFSDGRLAQRPLDPRHLDESCPFGRGAGGLILRAFFQTAEVQDHLTSWGCVSVDWNRDGVFAPRGSTVEAPLQLESDGNRMVRYQRIDDRTVYRGPADLTIAGDLLFDVQSVAQPGGEPAVAVAINGGIECNECPDPGYEPCWQPDDPMMLWRATTGGPGGGPQYLAPTSFAAQGMVEADGTPLMILVYAEGAAWRYGVLVANAAYGTFFTDVGPMGGDYATSYRGWQKPDITAVDDEILLVRADSSGQVTLTEGALDGRQVTWSAPAIAREAGTGAPLLLGNDNSPAITTVDWPGVGRTPLLAVPVSHEIRLYTRIAVGTWAGTWLWETTIPVTEDIADRPSLAQTVYPGGNRIVLTWLTGAGSTVRYVESHPGRPTDFRSKEYFHLRIPSAYTPPLIWDDRPSSDHPALRATLSQLDSCAEHAECTGITDFCAPIPGTTQGYCQSADGDFLATKQFLSPFADGVFVGRTFDWDDRPALREYFCRDLREKADEWTPSRWREVDASGLPYGARICDHATIPAPVCNPVPQADTDGDGYANSRDACPTVAVGRVDIGEDGCPDAAATVISFGTGPLVGGLRADIDAIHADASVPDAAAVPMQAAIDDLIGADDGKGTDGMMDELARKALLPAAAKADEVLVDLQAAVTAGFFADDRQRQVLGVYLSAVQLTGATSTAFKAKIAEGEALEAAGDLRGALGRYRDAAKLTL